MTQQPLFPVPIVGLRREIDRLFEDILNRDTRSRAMWAPAVDVRETEKELALEFELPGIKEEDVEITCENGVLQVRGEKREERREQDEEGRYHLVERQYGTFSRSFQLPHGVDESGIEAAFEEGLLRIRVPKAEQPKPRRIQIGGRGRSGRQGREQEQIGRGSNGEKSREREVQYAGARGEQEGSRRARGGGRSEGEGSERSMAAQAGGDTSEKGAAKGSEGKRQGSSKRS